MSTLSDVEVKIFLEEVLCIEDAKTKFKHNKEKLLREILYQFQHVEPYHSIVCLGTKPEDRHLPLWDEIKENLFRKRGGRCYVANQFMKILLEKIGYDVYHTRGSVLKAKNNHVCTLVRDLNQVGDLHMADVGIGYPTWDPIPLNFEVESPVYHVGFLYFKFQRNGDIITRLHKNDKRYEFPVNIDSKAWHEFMVMRTTPCELTDMQPVMTAMYTVPGAYNSSFLKSLKCVIFKNGKLVAFKDSTFLYENDDHQLQVEQITTRKKLVSKILMYFPQFTLNMVEAALDASITLKFD
ncbi:uncharacterized protein LOC117116529 [Anneissia japonica]|uniref:uncharacterized protein LOC117116529 n=1 Tax=Anneissia japonica TaxID=1529436 RepID=UPI00142595D7|nr:uncharacterized protein LOC117116529 [Anneissia japonica]XP_033116478.1 uncharacterized protein LOC117116529 [Anneissia japonica]